MIIATIGSTELVIESLNDANALLDIISRAVRIDERYSSDYTKTFYIKQDGLRVAVRIVGETLCTEDEYERMKQASASLTVVAEMPEVA